MAWRGADSEEVIAMAAPDIRWAQWMRVARGFQLRIGMRDHRREKFDGFIREVCLETFVSLSTSHSPTGSRQTCFFDEESLQCHTRDRRSLF